MANIPIYLSLAFVLVTLVTIGIFYAASNRNKTALIIIVAWLLIQGILGYFGFYNAPDAPVIRLASAFAPSMILIASIFISPRGRVFLQQFDHAKLTLLHTIRIPVELILYGLFIFKAIPEIMTFDGKNYDILAGITAPIIYFFAFYKKALGKEILLAWNFISVFLLLNIIYHAIFSLELPFQQFGLDQPNRAVRYFPFNWLPSVVVPLVLFSHLITIKQFLSLPDNADN